MFTTAAFPGRSFQSVAEFRAALEEQKNLCDLLLQEVTEVEVSLGEEHETPNSSED